MNFLLQGPFKDSVHNIMRKISYFFLGQNEEKGELIFARPARGYPRFHLYIKADGDNLIFSLHLDQKKPIYRGATAHAGEYDSELVQKEVKRIKQIFQE
jgi:hypothetical protein